MHWPSTFPMAHWACLCLSVCFFINAMDASPPQCPMDIPKTWDALDATSPPKIREMQTCDVPYEVSLFRIVICNDASCPIKTQFPNNTDLDLIFVLQGEYSAGWKQVPVEIKMRVSAADAQGATDCNLVHEMVCPCAALGAIINMKLRIAATHNGSVPDFHVGTIKIESSSPYTISQTILVNKKTHFNKLLWLDERDDQTSPHSPPCLRLAHFNTNGGLKWAWAGCAVTYESRKVHEEENHYEDGSTTTDELSFCQLPDNFEIVALFCPPNIHVNQNECEDRHKLLMRLRDYEDVCSTELGKLAKHTPLLKLFEDWSMAYQPVRREPAPANATTNTSNTPQTTQLSTTCVSTTSSATTTSTLSTPLNKNTSKGTTTGSSSTTTTQKTTQPDTTTHSTTDKIENTKATAVTKTTTDEDRKADSSSDTSMIIWIVVGSLVFIVLILVVLLVSILAVRRRRQTSTTSGGVSSEVPDGRTDHENHYERVPEKIYETHHNNAAAQSPAGQTSEWSSPSQGHQDRTAHERTYVARSHLQRDHLTDNNLQATQVSSDITDRPSHR